MPLRKTNNKAASNTLEFKTPLLYKRGSHC
jgi:hypothetical protein